MPNRTVSIPANALTGLRLTCKTCGAQMLIPLPVRNTPERCFSCGTDLPGAALLPLLQELSWLFQSAPG